MSQFGIEASRAAQYAIAFAIILVLVALFGLVLRKLTGGRLMMSGQDRSRARQPRLGVVDIYDLDRQRQLVLLRRDNVEHLLLVGGLNDVVIETNIVRVAGARVPAAAAEQGPERFEPAFEQPRPQVETPGRPSIETQLAAQLGSFMKRPQDEPEDAAEPPAPASAYPAPKPAPAPAFKAEEPVQPAPSETRRPDSAFADLSAVPRTMPEPPAIRVEPRYTPPLFQSRPTPQPPAPPLPPSPPPAAIFTPEPFHAPEPPVVERAGPDAAVLSDMAKQLEEALKRPAAAPEQDERVPPAIEDNPAFEDELLEPVAPPAFGPGSSATFREVDVTSEDIVIESEIVEVSHRDAIPSEPDATEPVITPAPPPPAPAASAPPKAEADKVADPFSVEEIEAEFARLLGRPLDPGKKG
nr:flagellar biosynthetic protein FliO [Microvirga antarctica]